MSEIVVTASRIDEELRDALTHTTVLTAQDIEAAHVPDVVTLLRREAGIEIAQDGGVGHVAGLFMRGGNSNQTLVLVDGVRLNTATEGTAPIEQIMLDQVERIEIVRGDVSALYGSEASSGVVQIFTLRGSGAPHLSATLGAGGRGTRTAAASFGGEAGDTQFNVAWSAFHTLGFPALKTSDSPFVNGADDGYSNQTMSGSLKQRIDERNSIGGSFYQSDGRTDYNNAQQFNYDGSPANPNDTYKDAERVAVWQAYWDARFLPAWHSRLSAGDAEDRLQDWRNADPQDRTVQHNFTTTWQNDLTVAPATTVSGGLEYLHQSVDAQLVEAGYANYERTGRTAWSEYLQVKTAVGPNQLQLAGRHTEYSDFGSHDTYFAGYGFAVTDSVKLIASESTGFRAPTFAELFYPQFGNPSLGPESVRTTELGAQWAVAQQFLRLALFRSRYHDLIAYPPNGIALANVNSAEVRGAELSYRGRLLSIDWAASITVQRPWDISNDAPLLRRARRFADLGASRAFGPFQASLDWHVSGRKEDIDPYTFNDVQVAGYGTLDAALSYSIAKEWKLSVSGVNLFNRDYMQVQGYNAQPRTIMLTAAYRPQ
jgi:vitamin B12 transporter